MNRLKGLRIGIALFFFLSTSCFFLDFTNHLIPGKFLGLLQLQLVPAVLSGAFLTVLFICVLTLLFGRVYCAVICPSGILQDIFIRLSKRGKSKKNKHKRWFTYKNPKRILPFILLGASIASPTLLSLSDPYSNFGRIAANLFRPVFIFGNNVLADLANAMGNYSFYHISIQNITILAWIASVIILLLFAILSVWRGRLFCNTLCPVGAFLSIFSRYSLFQVRFDKEKCNRCGQCERVCKAECIDSQSQKIDASRCVNCFNCLSSCKKGSLEYQFVSGTKKKKTTEENNQPESESRRAFLTLSSSILVTAPFLAGCSKQTDNYSGTYPILPPGAKNIKRFSEKCTSCHFCVVNCPNQIIQPAGLEYGINHLLKPRLVYTKGYCNYECTICSEVCPNKALESISKEEKITTQLGIAKFERERCVVYIDETDCGACSEHCPTQAVKMIPYKDSLWIPQVTPDICVGCGGCEYICPASPKKAIHVVANAEHLRVQKPEYEKVEEVEEIDFGF